MNSDRKAACPICGVVAETSQSFECFDDRYGYTGTYFILRCLQCGHGFINETFSADSLQDMYTNYYPRSNFDLDSYPQQQKAGAFTTWLNGDMYSPFRWVTPGTRVLDIGCGFGESLGYLQAQGCDAYGVEADENIRRVADKFGYKVHVGLFDPAAYEDTFFDFITLGQVIEHVTDPLQTLKDIAKVLKPRGIAILSTPSIEGWGARVFGRLWINWHAPYHLQFFTRQSMLLAAEKAGLKLETVKTITPSHWLHAQWMHLVSIPSVGEPSIFWVHGGSWSFSRKLARFGIRILHKLKIDHVLTRIFDALGIGDNRVYFLRKP